MSIPDTMTQYLRARNVAYTAVEHRHSGTSLESARTAHVDADHLAKAVLLEDAAGSLLAVLPATRELDLKALADCTGRTLELVPEERLGATFSDCAHGAVPAIGPAYGVATVVDNALVELRDVYFEAGSHEQLIRVAGADFRKLLPDATYAGISEKLPAAQPS